MTEFIIYLSLNVTITPNVIAKLVCDIFYIFHIISYTLAFIKNPGIPSLNNSKLSLENESKEIRNTTDNKMTENIPTEKKVNYLLCRECLLYHSSEVKTIHCLECGVCIEGYDHHCPWIGKCVGRDNIFFFHCFVISSLLTLVSFILLGITSK